MKFTALLTVLSASTLMCTTAIANPASPPSQCESAGSTGLTYQCFQKELEVLDTHLKQLLHSVPTSIADVPSQEFRDLWAEHVEREHLDASDVTQLTNFQQARHAYCSYVNSMAFQGTGYGSFVLKCEIELTQAALNQVP